MIGDLKLTFPKFSGDSAPLVAIINRWIGDMPRVNPDGFQVDGQYSLSGNFIVSGVSFEVRPFYSISAWIDEETAKTLLAIWDISQVRRRSGGAWQIAADDETELFFEEKTAATKTRSEVAGTSVIEQNGGVYYYARRQVYMPKKPVFGIDYQGDRSCIFTLQETGVKI